MTDIPHFAIPFRFKSIGSGAVAADVTEQDSFDEIFDCVETLMRYHRGYLADAPDFGTTDQTFTSPKIDTDKMRQEVDEWEPRAETAISLTQDRFDALKQRIQEDVFRRQESA